MQKNSKFRVYVECLDTEGNVVPAGLYLVKVLLYELGDVEIVDRDTDPWDFRLRMKWMRVPFPKLSQERETGHVFMAVVVEGTLAGFLQHWFEGSPISLTDNLINSIVTDAPGGLFLDHLTYARRFDDMDGFGKSIVADFNTRWLERIRMIPKIEEPSTDT